MAGTYRICVIPGDGVGTEVVPQALRVLDATAAACGFGLEFDQRPWGSAYYREHGADDAAGRGRGGGGRGRDPVRRGRVAGGARLRSPRGG